MMPHHLAWLSAHPDRSEAWLSEKIAEGFDVHHVDKNKANNAPENLVLIDHEDHMRLHGLKMVRYKKTPEETHREKFIRGWVAYDKRSSGCVWREVGAVVGISHAKGLAEYYAESRGLPHPNENYRPRVTGPRIPREIFLSRRYGEEIKRLRHSGMTYREIGLEIGVAENDAGAAYRYMVKRAVEELK